MRALESLRRVAAVVILGASASLLVAGCAEYYPQDVDTSGYTAEWNASQNAAQAARIEAARPTPEQIKAREAAASRAICVEGSMAECEAACDGGRLAMCVTLAQELHSGARVTADPERADRVLARACDGGRLDACLQRGVWLTSSDADEAAELFMRGCEAQRTDSVTTTMSCGLWMTLLDQHVYEPNDGALPHLCARTKWSAHSRIDAHRRIDHRALCWWRMWTIERSRNVSWVFAESRSAAKTSPKHCRT